MNWDLKKLYTILQTISRLMISQDRAFLNVEDIENNVGKITYKYHENLAKLLNQLKRLGIIFQRDNEIRFQHESYKFYFAAMWMKQNCGIARIVYFSYFQKWMPAVEFLCGILEPKKLRLLLLCKYFSIFGVFAFNKNAEIWIGGNNAVVLANYLVHSVDPPIDLIDKLIAKLPKNPDIYIKIPDYLKDEYGTMNTWGVEFYRLLGLLGTESAFLYLVDCGNMDKSNYGISQFKTKRALTELASRARHLAEEKFDFSLKLSLGIAFRSYPSELLLDVFENLIEQESSSEIQGMMIALTQFNFESRHKGEENLLVTNDLRLINCLFELISKNWAPSVRISALKFMKSYHGWSKLLPEGSHWQEYQFQLLTVIKESDDWDVASKALDVLSSKSNLGFYPDEIESQLLELVREGKNPALSLLIIHRCRFSKGSSESIDLIKTIISNSTNHDILGVALDVLLLKRGLNESLDTLKLSPIFKASTVSKEDRIVETRDKVRQLQFFSSDEQYHMGTFLIGIACHSHFDILRECCIRLLILDEFRELANTFLPVLILNNSNYRMQLTIFDVLVAIDYSGIYTIWETILKKTKELKLKRELLQIDTVQTMILSQSKVQIALSFLSTLLKDKSYNDVSFCIETLIEELTTIAEKKDNTKC